MVSYPPTPPETGLHFTSVVHEDTYPAITPEPTSHRGKAVLITGATKGIGRATSLSFARAGASYLALAARGDLSSLEAEIRAACRAASLPAPQVLLITLDVQSQASVDAAAALTRAHFPRLDILYNNAGYLEDWTPIVASDPAEWWRTWEVNVRGMYLMTRAFLPVLLATEGGDKTIVNTSSIGAHGIRPGASSYQSTKFAVCKFTEFVMAENVDKGVLCFAVHPGGVMTELSSAMPETLRPFLGDKAECAADSLVYLTKEKRDWLAGRYISLVWDMPELLSREKEIVDGGKLKFRLIW